MLTIPYLYGARFPLYRRCAYGKMMVVTYQGDDSMLTNFAVFGLGTPELLLILVIILLLFGGKKLPELSRSLGESVRELRKGMNTNEDKKKQTGPAEADDTRS
jgi:sec-independent protein translocase protein TatA